MNDLSSQVFESFVPVYDAIPDEWQDARAFVVEQFKRLANAVNIREIGWFLDEELLSGKAFIPTIDQGGGATNQVFRQVLRKVIDFGMLPNAGTKTVPHGITFDSNFTLTFMTAAATDPVGFNALPIPYANPTALNTAISLSMDSTNVVITTGINLNNYTRCYVTIEYLQEL